MSSSIITSTSDASVLPTIGGTDITDDVRLAIGDTDSDDYEFSNSDLLIFFNDAIRAYQDYRPYTLKQSITLVANQKDYALPDTCIELKSHTYRTLPGLSSDIFVAYYNLYDGVPFLVPYYEWTDPILTRARDSFYRRLDELGAGQAEVIDYQTSYAPTKYLRIFPTPTSSGGTFEITFTADHPILNNNYFTIPARHAIYIQKLLRIKVLETRLTKMESTANEFASGTTRTQFDASMKFLSNQIADLKQEVQDALTSPKARTG